MTMQTNKGEHIDDPLLRSNIISEMSNNLPFAIEMCIHLDLRWEVITDLLLESMTPNIIKHKEVRHLIYYKGIVIATFTLDIMNSYDSVYLNIKKNGYRIQCYIYDDATKEAKHSLSLCYNPEMTDPFSCMYTSYMIARVEIAKRLKQAYCSGNSNVNVHK